MSPKFNFSSLVNLFKTPYAVQGQSPVEHGFQNGENKSGTNSITRTIRKKPNKRSKVDRRPSPDDSMTGQRELGTTSRTVGPESCRLSTFKPLVISTYNVIRTLHQQGKTHQLFMGCSDVGIDVLQCNNMSTPITERYESFENAVKEVAEKVVGRCSPCGMPSWVSDRTKQLRTERDVAKRKYLLSKSKPSREIWRKLNSSLNESYKADEMARLNKQMEELKLADSKGDYSTTWKIIHDLSGKDRNVKVKMRDGTPPKSDKDLLAEWQEYFSSLLNNDNGQVPFDLPQPAAQDLPIHDHPPTLEETLETIRQMKTNKAAGFDCAITAEALQDGGDAMADVIHCFCAEVYSNLTPPDQWITSVIVPLPRKGDLSLMTNYRGISLLSIAAKVYNKMLLNRIRDEVDPILRKNKEEAVLSKSTFWEGSWKALEITSYLLLSTLLTSKKPLIPSTGKSCSQFFDTMGFQKL